jgi:hypothetical protein
MSLVACLQTASSVPPEFVGRPVPRGRAGRGSGRSLSVVGEERWVRCHVGASRWIDGFLLEVENFNRMNKVVVVERNCESEKSDAHVAWA